MKITLKTLPQATAQEVADQIVTHLLTQNKRCGPEDVACRYRWYGKKCAAGCLIADDEYKRKMDTREGNTGWGSLVALGWVPPDHQALITRFQYIHDCGEVEEWYDALKNLVEKEGLKFNWEGTS